ncbi:MAG: hypothetical protein M9958_08110 [Chitinophagales bacterium]|nr:hypothetical protein [Chitinophagales bacterium]
MISKKYIFLLSMTLLLSKEIQAEKVDSIETQVKEKPKVKIGGALRFNYNLSDWKKEQVKRGGDFGYELFRLNAEASYKNLELNAEYRIYDRDLGGGMLRNGWIGYHINPKHGLQLGLTQVPFGITNYNSNCWFLSINYYLGLEEDHDMGLRYNYNSDKFDINVAFFKNAEELSFGDNSDAANNRYSYDVGSIDLGNGVKIRNKEVNQGNIKFVYKHHKTNIFHQIGASVKVGGLYNLDTRKTGGSYAAAVHYEMNVKRFALKSQIITYQYNPKSPNEENKDIIALTAYDAPYFIASKANTYTLGLSYTFPFDKKILQSIKVYNDFGYMQKFNKKFDNSIMNVSGAMITTGPIYTFVDFAFGKNHPWLGAEWTNAFSNGATKDPWGFRFNINVGYYF